MNKIKTLLIDDEQLARALVLNFIKSDPQFEVIGEASDGFEGMKLIQELKPDLIFLDIQMPKITGLEMLELIENPPIVVFSTAFDQYAIDAFEKNAVDYLLKPFSKERFTRTLEKVKLKFEENHSESFRNSETEIKALIKDIGVKSLERVVVKNGNKIEVIPSDQIVYLEAYGDYVWVHTPSAKHLKQSTMKEFEVDLPSNFVRVHRSYLVNIEYIQKLELYDKNSYLVILKNNHKLTVSRNGYKELKEILGW
jgi:two-component system, LytTR family, response regulator